MARIFYPTNERLKFLLESVHNREVALPDFQRDFVWRPRMTEELLESILENHPAGSLLRIKNSDAGNDFFAPRPVEGAPELLKDARPSHLILDGQQRLTSLYQALYGVGDHRFFVDMRAMMEGKDIEDCVFYLTKRRAKRWYGTIEQQATELVFPLSILFNGKKGGTGKNFEDWLDKVVHLNPEGEKLKEGLRDVNEDSLVNIKEYEFPVVTLSERTKPEAICTIFETLNRTGVKLSVYDLLVSRFYPQNVRLRDMWDDALRKNSVIRDFYGDEDPYHILQAIALFTGAGAPSCKRGDVLKMQIEQIRQGWDSAIRGFAEILKILREDCGIAHKKYVPYYTMLIPVGAVLAEQSDRKAPGVAATVREKIKRWFWCSVFEGAYENSPNTQASQDYRELSEWLKGGKEPKTVRDFSFDPNGLRDARSLGQALYCGCLALILSKGAKDFYSASPIAANMMEEKRIDDHHIFPSGYLDRESQSEKANRNCVLNRTLISKDTNTRIGAKAPAEYLGEIEKEIGGDRLDQVLESHLLPTGAESALRQNNFDAFMDARQELLYAKIREVTGE